MAQFKIPDLRNPWTICSAETPFYESDQDRINRGRPSGAVS